MPRTLRLVPIAIVLAGVLAGCGSSGPSQAPGAKQLVAQADPICKKVAVKREAANASLHGTSASTLAALARLAPEVAVTEHEAVTRLRTLSAPTSLTHDWQLMLAGMQQLADDTTQIGHYAKANDLPRVESITSGGRKLRAELTAIAQHVGFVYCGRTS